MTDTAKLHVDGQVVELPVVTGTEGERAIDITKLRSETGLITLDPGYGNTGSCKSEITFIDGDAGILRYRGLPIEELATRSSFIEVAELLIFGELPDETERAQFRQLLTDNSSLHRDMRRLFDGFPTTAHPMAMLSATINALQAYDLPEIDIHDETSFRRAAALLLSKVRTLAAAAYKSSRGEPFVYPRYDLAYAENFLHMMFSEPYREHAPDDAAARALNMFLVLHADHEQNCSTSTVRMVASGGANLYASVSAGVSALWGARHGGANMAVIEMLREIHEGGTSPSEFIRKAKDKSSGVRLMGFGHRVYRNFDPRAKVLKAAADDLLAELRINDPLLDIAREVEELALSDDYFVERKLFPNVDFYSGIILRALGIPLNMYTVMFAMGRMPGWIAHWREANFVEGGRIHRPRQVYVGNTITKWQPRAERKPRRGFLGLGRGKSQG